jgi:hypothetical protein
MSGESILGGSELVAFAPTTDPTKAYAFYEGVLGLRLVADEKPFALIFDANGTMLRVTTVHEFKPIRSQCSAGTSQISKRLSISLQQRALSLIATRE